MSIALLIALLLQTGTCAQSQFRGSDGVILNIVVCPTMVPAQAGGELPGDEPPSGGPDEPLSHVPSSAHGEPKLAL